MLKVFRNGSTTKLMLYLGPFFFWSTVLFEFVIIFNKSLGYTQNYITNKSNFSPFHSKSASSTNRRFVTKPPLANLNAICRFHWPKLEITDHMINVVDYGVNLVQLRASIKNKVNHLFQKIFSIR